MILKKTLRLNFIVLTIILNSNISYATEFKLAIEHGDKDLFSYAISLLNLALSSNPEHSVSIIDKPNLTQGRLFDILVSEQAEFNMIISGSTPEYIEKAHIIKVPISRGLLGNRLFVISKINYALFDDIKSLNQLREKVTIGSGYHWVDTMIFRHNGFEVEVAEFEQLYKMLQKNRFEGFNRGMFEAYSEMEMYKNIYPELIVYPNLMVRYKFDYYYFTNTLELRDELQRALESIYESGEFMTHFYNHPHIKKSLDNVITSKLRIFELENPFEHKSLLSIPENYWHDILQ